MFYDDGDYRRGGRIKAYGIIRSYRHQRFMHNQVLFNLCTIYELERRIYFRFRLFLVIHYNKDNFEKIMLLFRTDIDEYIKQAQKVTFNVKYLIYYKRDKDFVEKKLVELFRRIHHYQPECAYDKKILILQTLYISFKESYRSPLHSL